MFTPQFTVVAACYNVANYLNDFMESLVKQDIGFTKYICCVLVNDGSTDNTAELLQQWQVRYPDNITVLHKNNGGQASARNLGMQYVTTKWVTFTDPDDSLDQHFFSAIQASLRSVKQPITMVGTHSIFYKEEQHKYVDSHPLTFKFKHGVQVLPISNLGLNIQLSMASALFLTESIKKLNLTIDERIKPNFEDGHFIVRYLAQNDNDAVLYCANAKYYYHKRANHSSTLDGVWQDKRHYLDVLKYGYLDVLQQYSSLPFVQNTVLYDLIWFFEHLVNNPERASVLTSSEQAEHLALLQQCFNYITEDTILNFSLKHYLPCYKFGILACFKHLAQPTKEAPVLYIEDWDPYKQEVQVSFFTTDTKLVQFFGDGHEIIPTHYKAVKNDYLGQVFNYEYIYWVSTERHTVLTCAINQTPAMIAIQHKVQPEMTVQEIRQYFKIRRQVYPANAPWLLLDRDTKADDNAEHLYRWLKQHHPEQKIYFGIDKNSPDYARLKAAGFNVLALGSFKHFLVLWRVGKIISSHTESFVDDYFHLGVLKYKQIIFLQHGVTKDDISRWLNSRRRIDLCVTTTVNEHQSIIANDSRYRFTDKTVQLLGMPRYDALIKLSPTNNKCILVIPTWRKNSITASADGKTHFLETTYVKAWRSFLFAPQLKELSTRYGYHIIFSPHPLILPYLKDFPMPDYIEVNDANAQSIQKLFQQARLLITDYSSVSCDFAFTQKMVLYYQFDADTFFNGLTHTYQKGYFSYEKDGFGPVVYDQESLFKELAILLAQDCKPQEPYLSRIAKTFTCKDGNNCQRVYEAICALDKPNPQGYVNEAVLKSYAFDAANKQAWELAKQRFTMYDSFASNELTKVMLLICDIKINYQQEQAKALLKSMSIPALCRPYLTDLKIDLA